MVVAVRRLQPPAPADATATRTGHRGFRQVPPAHSADQLQAGIGVSITRAADHQSSSRRNLEELSDWDSESAARGVTQQVSASVR